MRDLVERIEEYRTDIARLREEIDDMESGQWRHFDYDQSGRQVEMTPRVIETYKRSIETKEGLIEVWSKYLKSLTC